MNKSDYDLVLLIEEDVKVIGELWERLRVLGLTEDQIAHALGPAWTTLRKRCVSRAASRNLSLKDYCGIPGACPLKTEIRQYMLNKCQTLP
jgi:hypothetical protein